PGITRRRRATPKRTLGPSCAADQTITISSARTVGSGARVGDPRRRIAVRPVIDDSHEVGIEAAADREGANLRVDAVRIPDGLRIVPPCGK
ncbi:MAG: hypothetical protein ACLFRZ_10475, partial [Rhodosalinus sp.]